jgi:hypothetical protein
VKRGNLWAGDRGVKMAADGGRPELGPRSRQSKGQNAQYVKKILTYVKKKTNDFNGL